MMAADSDGYSITTVVTCEGDLTDPTFPRQLERVIGSLQDLLGGKWHICKLEPWNSVRVTLSIPREAALRLRHLATEGSQQLRALGILSVQVEGDQVISLRLAGPEPQEIILRTTQQDGNSTSTTSADTSLSHLTGEAQMSNTTVASSSEKIQFRSPNVVCPTDTVVPKVPTQSIASSSSLPNARTYSGPFPFTSMNQAIHNRDSLSLGANYSTPPPPYPGKHPPITISSPLLVNLLQNDGATLKPCKSEPESITSPITTGSTVQTNGAAISSSIFKYSATTTTCTQDTSSMKGPVSTTTTALLKKNVTNATIKTHSVTASSASSTLASSNSTSVPNISDFSTVIANSHSSILPLPSVTQCNSTVSVSSKSQQNYSLNNSSNLHSAPVLPVSCTSNSNSGNSSTKQTSTVLHLSIPKSSSTSPKCNESQGPNHIANSIKPQSRLSNSLPLSTTSVPCTSTSNISQLSLNCINRSTAVRTVSSFRPCPPPPYSSRPFEPIAQPMPQLLELTPSLTELKGTDLDQLLPTLEHELARSPPTLAEELTNTSNHCSYLINPLTGELEPHINSDSDIEEPSDIFTGLPSPTVTSDEDTNSMSRPDTTDQSDSESRSTHSDSSKNSRLKCPRNRERGRDSPNLKPTEKIKLRLKLEKSEPVSPAYKVDVSFINLSAKKTSSANVTGEELRVPPLHISLRGRNHAVINNRKKVKINSDSDSASKSKIRKTQQEPMKLKKSSSNILKESPLVSDQAVTIESGVSALMTMDHAKGSASEQRKTKKLKSGHEYREQNLLTGGNLLDKEIGKHAYNCHFKERRGSDSELVHSVKRYAEYAESNGISLGDKKRRLSHTDQVDVESQLFVLGSTNTGTVTTLPIIQKPRKEKMKSKDSSKGKELNRNKSYAKNVADKLKQTTLPTGEIDMEAKFKQRLLEDTEKGVPRPPHRTETLPSAEGNQYKQNEKEGDLVKTSSEPLPIKDKPPELTKSNITDRKPDLTEKQAGRSPNSGGQGEDSGIESMDALSEKSPNQASQSPHTDITDTMKSKPQVPSILDIEAQLAKMEGLNGEDVNDNKHSSNAKIEQCCGLTSALQDSLKQGTVTLTTHSTPALKEQLPQVEVSLVPLKASQNDEDLEPQPVRISPPRYTYSNPDKSRGSESPSLSDSDSNSCSLLLKNKSLLEQLLIEIPDNQNPSSPSPVTRSLRTRASSKLSSPELNSPIPPKQSRVPAPKRKRHESDSSSNSLEDTRNKKPRKCSENAAELIKACMGVESSKGNIRKNKLVDDSSDSDEPLIEVAGKVRKNNINTARAKFKSTSFVGNMKAGPVKTRSSVRTMPALNTRSKGDKTQPNANMLRRKTRSSVSEGEGKRRKDVK